MILLGIFLLTLVLPIVFGTTASSLGSSFIEGVKVFFFVLLLEWLAVGGIMLILIGAGVK